MRNLLFFGLALAGCAGGSSTVSASLASTITAVPGPLALDPPSHLNATIDELDVHSGHDWIQLLAAPVTIDLLDQAKLSALVDGADVPPGRITQLRLVLDATPSFVSGNTSTPVACPSCTQTGLKVVTEGAPVLAAGESLDLTLDFSGTFDTQAMRLDPVLVIAR